MHDIGRVIDEPQILRMGYSDNDIARWSSEIIAESPLSRVATHVRHQYEPYRKPGEQTDPDVSIVSRIIKVAAAYDWQFISRVFPRSRRSRSSTPVRLTTTTPRWSHPCVVCREPGVLSPVRV